MSTTRYHGIAIGLHWSMAILIIFMLALGKYMTGLEVTDPSRFSLTQLHKSIGIVLLLLLLWRLYWRLTHKPPSLADALERWEIVVAEATHWLLYFLLLAVPLSGWIMVSASPLNLPTVLFKVIPWPHLPLFDTLSNRAEIAELFEQIHDIAASIMIVLLLGHIGAALRHHFILRDDILIRMSPRDGKTGWVPGFGRFAAVAAVLAAGVIALAATSPKPPALGAGDSNVGFVFTMFETESSGAFADSSVELQYDPEDPDATVLSAIVQTASLNTGDSQVDSALPQADWFDVKTHPQATFQSSSIAQDKPGTLTVNGDLTIKGITRAISFPLYIQGVPGAQTASGGFAVNRLDFDIGATDQPDDSTVGYNVVIEFNFELN